MRIIFGNQIDDLVASNVTALTETFLYEGTKTQDERLSTQWRTTAGTDQTIVFNAGSDAIVGGNIGLVTGSSATNLVTDPEDLTTANWTENTNVTVTAATSILGINGWSIVADDTQEARYLQSLTVATTITNPTVMITVRRGNQETARVRLRDIDASADRVEYDIIMSSKTVTYTAGSNAIDPEWIDDNTVRLFSKSADITLANDHQLYLYGRDGTGLTADSAIFSAPMVINNTYPVPYVKTTRSALNTDYAHQMPVSGKFIIDAEFFTFFPHDITVDNMVWAWRNDTNNRLLFYYRGVGNAFQLFWKNAGTNRSINSPVYDAGAARTVNQFIRTVCSVDLSEGGVATGTRIITIPRDQGSLDEATAWSGIIDAVTSTFSTLSLGHENSLLRYDGIFRHLRIYGGLLTDPDTTEAGIDAELATKQLVFEASTGTYQSQFNADTLAILGHNISEEADIKVELNDWDEWNYTDGSGSSIIQNTMTWQKETILTFLAAKKKRQYARFTINDPNASAGTIAIGRIWVGDYLTIDPSSLDNFSVTKMRSDRVQYGRNRQKWSDVGVGWRKFDLTFPRTIGLTSQSMLAKVQRMYDDVGNAKSVIFCNFDDLRSYEIVEPCYASFTGPIKFNHTRSQRYGYKLMLEEDK